MKNKITLKKEIIQILSFISKEAENITSADLDIAFRKENFDQIYKKTYKMREMTLDIDQKISELSFLSSQKD